MKSIKEDYSVTELAALLKKSRQQIQRDIDRNKFPHARKIGRQYVIPRKDVEKARRK